MAKFKRILLKLSGESLAGEQKQGINVERLNEYAQQIKEIAEILERNEATIKTQLARGRQLLETKLKGAFEDGRL